MFWSVPKILSHKKSEMMWDTLYKPHPPPSHRPSPAPLMTMFQSVTFIGKGLEEEGGGGIFLQVSLYIVVWVVSPYLALLNYA